MTEGIYAPVWRMIKNAGHSGAILNLNFQVEEDRLGRELTKSEKDSYFLRVIKAVGHRKRLDHEFYVEYPNARLKTLSKCYKTGKLHLVIKYSMQDNVSDSVANEINLIL